MKTTRPRLKRKRKASYTSSAFTLIQRLKGKNTDDSHFLITTGFERHINKKFTSSISAYVLVARTSQINAAATSTLSDFSILSDFLVASGINADEVRSKIKEKIERNISGAIMEEIRPDQLTKLLEGHGMRMSNTQLASDGRDIIEGGLATGGAFAAVAASTVRNVGVEWVFYSNARIAGPYGLAVATAGWGAYTTTEAVLESTRANSGYTLGDLVYDLTHPEEAGNPIWSSSDTSSGPPSSGTTLPPEFDTNSDPGRYIVFQIVMGLCINNAFGRSIVQRPVTLAGIPVEGADGVSNLDILLRFDALLGGAYFKLIQRAISSRRNSDRTPDPSADPQSSGGEMVVFTDCPPIDVQAMRLNDFLILNNAALRKI